jgi:hypothetical protein
VREAGSQSNGSPGPSGHQGGGLGALKTLLAERQADGEREDRRLARLSPAERALDQATRRWVYARKLRTEAREWASETRPGTTSAAMATRHLRRVNQIVRQETVAVCVARARTMDRQRPRSRDPRRTRTQRRTTSGAARDGPGELGDGGGDDPPLRGGPGDLQPAWVWVERAWPAIRAAHDAWQESGR